MPHQNGLLGGKAFATRTCFRLPFGARVPELAGGGLLTGGLGLRLGTLGWAALGEGVTAAPEDDSQSQCHACCNFPPARQALEGPVSQY